MSTTQIRYLQKRVKELESIVRGLALDLNFTESVGAAFAFDIGMAGNDQLIRQWDETLEKVVSENRKL